MKVHRGQCSSFPKQNGPMPLEATPSVLQSLQAELCAGTAWGEVILVALADKGLAHHHVRLVGTGLLARIPKQSQLGLAAQANLAYQQACFERAAASGHTPHLSMALPVTERLPRGALLVAEIDGRAAMLPGDLTAIAQALAAVHALPLPAAPERPPLHSSLDPLRTLAEEIEQQATHLPAAGLAAEVAACIQRELAVLRRRVDRPERPPCTLIAFDAHPGNFVVRASGQAVLVDLEKCRYAYPGLDLAHATLYTSTTWDITSQCELGVQDVAGFYETWSLAVGPEIASAAREWHVPLRHAMWLWSLTWCCKWRALSQRPPQASAVGEDWSAANSDAVLVAHVRNRVDHYLSPPAIALVLRELDTLQALFER